MVPVNVIMVLPDHDVNKSNTTSNATNHMSPLLLKCKIYECHVVISHNWHFDLNLSVGDKVVGYEIFM